MKYLFFILAKEKFKNRSLLRPSPNCLLYNKKNYPFSIESLLKKPCPRKRYAGKIDFEKNEKQCF